MMIVKITVMMLLLGGVTAGDRDSPPDKLGPDPVYNDTCVTTGGGKTGAHCVFPFQFNVRLVSNIIYQSLKNKNSRG